MVMGEYCCASLSLVLGKPIYEASIESLVNQCYRNKGPGFSVLLSS